MYLLALFAPVASAEIYRWEDENAMNFTDDLASVPEKYREKVSDESARQARNTVPQAESAETRRTRPVVARENQIAAYQDDNREQQSRAPAAIWRHQTNAPAVSAGPAEDTFPSLATAVVVCLLSTLFLAIVWVVTIVDISKSEFITPSIKTVWMTVVIFMPGIGMLFYYILGVGQKSS
jgi:hypothetical protein